MKYFDCCCIKETWNYAVKIGILNVIEFITSIVFCDPYSLTLSANNKQD